MLLFALAFLGMAFQGVDADDRAAMLAGILIYAIFVLGIRYAGRFVPKADWIIAVETWAMIPFITWTIWYTDKLASPLRNAYILIVVISALTLGMRSAMYQVGAVALCVVLLRETYAAEIILSVPYLSSLVARVTPLVVVAYVTALFSSDIRYSMNKRKLSSSIDDLTGIRDMAGFAIIADRLFHHAVRHDFDLGVLVIGIDDFKQLLDSSGRKVGDTLLRSVASRALAGLRHNDVLARCQDEEFVVLLPETSSAGAMTYADRLRQAVTGDPMEFEGKPLKASISIGHASLARDGGSLESLFERARRAMRSAMESGGNKVAVLAD